MSTSNVALPVPVTVQLPGEHWVDVDPGEFGVANAALMLMRRVEPGEYVPSLTVSGDWRNDPASLDMIADEEIARLRAEGATEVELVTRREYGTEDAPGLMQVVGARVSVEGRGYDIRQLQALVSVLDVRDPRRRVVLVHTLSCSFAQQEQMAQEFAEYLRTVKVQDPPEPAPED